MKRNFSEGLAQLNKESGGLLQLEIIQPEDHAVIAAAAVRGDPVAFSRLTAILQSGDVIRRLARNEGAVCLTCPGTVRNPEAALAILVPATEQATVAICSALCKQCSTGGFEEIMARAAIAYRAVWPGLRCIAVTHPEGGRA
jgi:mRNA-degrading endonuclease toxin of MazEF toxin-antitoxin module